MFIITTTKDRYITSIGNVPGEDNDTRFMVSRLKEDADPSKVDENGMSIIPDSEDLYFNHPLDLSAFDFKGNRIRAHWIDESGYIHFDQVRYDEIEADREEREEEFKKQREEVAKIPSNAELAISINDLEDCILEMSSLLYN